MGIVVVNNDGGVKLIILIVVFDYAFVGVVLLFLSGCLGSWWVVVVLVFYRY